jgi:hypothetical protein
MGLTSLPDYAGHAINKLEGAIDGQFETNALDDKKTGGRRLP